MPDRTHDRRGEVPRTSFLRFPAADRLSGGEVAPEDPAPDDTIEAPSAEDRYELGEVLGEGATGRVVRTYDHRLGRVVALKFLTHDDPEIRRLFLREARAQARVRHDHVLDVYDSGLLDGEPYIAMRYVEGPTLGEVAPQLALEQRVRLVAQVAEGLHAAHREGLLHRDVKPSNVLVEETSKGDHRAWVTDFGLASELADGDPTVAGAVAGSPRYIAPERLADGLERADRRADIYSLGVVLYELVTGRFPHGGADTIHHLRDVLSRPPLRPREVLPDLPADLEAVILRCLARRPGDRYGSAQAVAVDLRRWLDGEVVEAYAAGVAYRMTRFALRHKALTAVAGLALVGLLAASGVITVFAVRAEAARGVAETARDQAETRRGQAEELLRLVLVDVRGELESLGRLEVLDRVDEAALGYFDAVAPDDRSETELLHRARMLHGIGQGRLQRGRHAAAVGPLMESLALTRELWRRDPADDERLAALAQSEFWVGFVHWNQNRAHEARPYFVAYRDRSEELLGRDPSNDEWRRELGYSHSNLGMVLRQEGELTAALEEFRATLTIETDLAGRAPPRDRQSRLDLATTHGTVGKVLEQLGRLEEAESHLRQDVRIRRELAEGEPSEVPSRGLLGNAYGHLGIHLLLRGRLAEAREHFIRMRDVTLSLVRHDPEPTGWRYQLASSYLSLGRVALEMEEPEAFEEWLRRQGREVVDLLAIDPSHPAWRRARAEGQLLIAESRLRAGGEAPAALTTDALTTLQNLAAVHPDDSRIIRLLAWAHLLYGDARRAIRILEPLAPDRLDARFLAPWRDALACSGRIGEAETISRRMRELGFGLTEPRAVCPVSSSGSPLR